MKAIRLRKQVGEKDWTGQIMGKKRRLKKKETDLEKDS